MTIARSNGEKLDVDDAVEKYGDVCSRAGIGAQNAEELAESTYADPPHHLDGKEDAMRHCLWNAFMAQDPQVGPRYARVIAAMYERLGQNDADTAAMDQHNNEYGVRLFETGRTGTSGAAVAECRSAVENGRLVVLNP